MIEIKYHDKSLSCIFSSSALLLLCFLPSSCAGSAKKSAEPFKKRVILVSIDGFRPEFYRSSSYKSPTLKKIANSGVSADSMKPVFPSVTYPNHISLVTGVTPRKHGILSNTKFNWKDGPTTEWYWYAQDIKVKTLWDTLEAEGLKTAAIHWPVTVGANVSFLIPEIFPLKPWTQGKVWDLVNANSTKGLKKEINLAQKIKPYFDQKTADSWASKATAYIYDKHQPALTLVHLTMLDKVQHKCGRDSEELRNEVEIMDVNISNIFSVLQKDTCLMIVGDHGFLNYKNLININVLFSEKGWITLDKNGNLKSWKVIARKSGAQAGIYLKDAALKDQVVDLLTENQALGYTYISDKKLDELGAYGEAIGAISAINGFSIGRALEGELLSRLDQTRGQHGYLPEEHHIQTGFIALGCGEKKGSRITKIRNLQVTPTVLNILGLDWENLPDIPIKLRD